MIREKQISGMARSHNINDKKRVVNFLMKSFPDIKNKNNGWMILRKLLNDSNLSVKLNSISAIRLSFAYIPNKEEAWKCLLDLLKEQNEKIRSYATNSISDAFIHLPDKENGWMDLLEIVKTSNDDDLYPFITMRKCFENLEDKENGWINLLEIVKTSIEDGNVNPLLMMPRFFEKVEDKEKCLMSLEQLSNHDNVALRSISNNLIGRIYITKSVKAEGNAFNELYFKGIHYLKKSSDDFDISSHKFCYFMHNTFSKIIGGEIKDKDEIVDNIEELKIISEESNEKTKIIRILDDLYVILEETFEAQQNGEDISKFKDKIIPICIQLNVIIGTLDNDIIKSIAEKAQEKIHFEYTCTIRALKIVYDLIESPDKLTSEPKLIIDTIRLCCLAISEPACNHYKSKFEEIEHKNIDIDEKRTQLLQFIQELKPVLEQEKSLKEMIVSGQREIKTELAKVTERLEDCVISLNRTGPRQEIVISTGVEMLGTGAQVITTIPLKEIAYDEIQDDILQIKNDMPFSKISKRLKNKILEYTPNKAEK